METEEIKQDKRFIILLIFLFALAGASIGTAIVKTTVKEPETLKGRKKGDTIGEQFFNWLFDGK